jgi:hypothetical protein
MEIFKKYKSLEETLRCIKLQAKDSFDFARSFLPPGEMTGKQIFDFLKQHIVYKNDPPGIELLQSFQTLCSIKNKHGIYGAGDCDCFTIAALACLHVKGFKNIGIVLTGRSKNSPVHIYAYIQNKSLIIPFDLTNKKYGYERPYPYKQKIPVVF